MFTSMGWDNNKIQKFLLINFEGFYLPKIGQFHARLCMLKIYRGNFHAFSSIKTYNFKYVNLNPLTY